MIKTYMFEIVRSPFADIAVDVDFLAQIRLRSGSRFCAQGDFPLLLFFTFLEK